MKPRIVSSFAKVNVGTFVVWSVPSKTLRFLQALSGVDYKTSRDDISLGRYEATICIPRETSSQIDLSGSRVALR